MCNCIADMESKVRREHDAEVAHMEHWGACETEVNYRGLTKKGVLSKVWHYTRVPWKFCPFCGKEVK